MNAKRGYSANDVAIGISTFNRPQFVQAQGASLALCHSIGEATVVVIDDGSAAYDENFLRSVYPQEARVARAPRSSGCADIACRRLLQSLIATDRSLLVILDSDLIVHSNFINEVIRLAPLSSGLFSLLNAPSHPGVAHGNEFLRKTSIGAAGLVAHISVAKDIIKSVPEGPIFDWRMVEFLTSVGLPILSVRNSLVQHIGFADGQNSSVTIGDFGVGFLDNSAINAAAVNEAVVAALHVGFTKVSNDIRSLDERISALEMTAERAPKLPWWRRLGKLAGQQ